MNEWKNVTFAKFQGDCSGDGKNVIWKINKHYMDIFHPITASQTTLVDVDEEAKVPGVTSGLLGRELILELTVIKG